jgi:predicted DNA-binding protein (MmcQ/YjbR family)
MAPEKLRSACMALPGAEETCPFSEGLSVFKVEGKIFAISRLEGVPLQVSLKCEPELAEQLRITHPAIRPGYHLNKRHWNTVTLDGTVPDEMVQSLIEDSYALVLDALPKRVQEKLRAAGR